MAQRNGLDDLTRRIRAMGVEARREIGVAVDSCADEQVTIARSMAPLGETGKLKESIRKEPGAHELARLVEAGGPLTTKAYKGRAAYEREVKIGVSLTGVAHDNRNIARQEGGAGVSYDYATGVEFGTSDTPAQPFFWPAYRLMKRRFRGRMNRAIRKAAKAAGWSA